MSELPHFVSPRAKEEMRSKYRYAIFEEMAKLAEGELTGESFSHFAETGRFGVSQGYFTVEEMDKIVDTLLSTIIPKLPIEAAE